MDEQSHLEIILEDMNSRFDFLIKGNQGLQREIHGMRTELKGDIELCNFKIDTLNQKIDGVEEKLNQKIDCVEQTLSQKIDGVPAELKAHRADTEIHHGVYGVKE